MASGISTDFFEELYAAGIDAGASGGKISGAGGGGFIFFYCPDNTRYKVANALQKFGGSLRRFEFTSNGLETWTIR